MKLMSVATLRLCAMWLAFLLAALPDLAAAGAMLSAGGDASFSLKADGSLLAWGENGIGHLGNGSQTDKPSPVLVGSGYVAVSAGDNHTVALKTDGGLWAWGYNFTGQLGQSAAEPVFSASPLRVGGDFVAAAAGGDFAVALKTNGSLWTWGDNRYGQLGDGTSTYRSLPAQIGSGFTAVAAGGFHALALKADGSLWAWGNNDHGQRGDGSTSTTFGAPQQIGIGYTAIAAGRSHSLALQADGSLWAWGANGNGQLGDGSTTDVNRPIKIGTGYTALDGGANFTAAIKDDGSLWAWGSNSSGQLGNATTVDQLTPILIGSGYSTVALGANHALAIKADGSVWAWGNNTSGQVGNGSTSARHSPVQVVDKNGFPAGDIVLNIAIGGWGSVVINPAGITCNQRCTQTFSAGSSVTLSATPWVGDVFSGWSGACSGIADCQISASADVTANFVPLALPVHIAGMGTVSASPSGQVCFPPGCVISSTLGTLTLSATAEPGYRFSGWSGPCSGTDSCRLGMNSILDIGREVTANFVALPRVAVTPLLPLVPGSFWTFVDPAGGNAKTTTVGAAVTINGRLAYPLNHADGSAAYFSNDAQGLRLHGQYAPQGLYASSVGWVSTRVYFDPPILLAAADALPDVRNYFSGNAGITVGGGLGSYVFRYDGSALLAAAASVTVPLGTYPAHRLAYSFSVSGTAGGYSYTIPVDIQDWYVSGFGIVKEASGGVERVLSASNVPQPPIKLAIGWNLVGNSVEAALPVATTFNAAAVASVWKWVTTGTTPGLTYPTWAFYTPAHADGGQAHAASRGYEFLSTINAGEGFWVNALAAYSAPLPSGAAVAAASFRPAPTGGAHALPHGWSLIATGDQPNPAGFAQAIAPAGTPLPAAGQVYGSLSTLWSWNTTQGRWYFWAPSLVNSGGLADYAAIKGYLDFATQPATPAGTLAPTTGFWVNLP